MARWTSYFSVLALLLLLHETTALDATVDALGPTQKIVVNLTFVEDGVSSSPQPCKNDSACTGPTLMTAENVADSSVVVISYAVNSSFPANESATYAIRACFAPSSQTDRGWRKDKKAINPAESNQCKKLVVAGLSGPNGTYTWKLPNNLAAAKYNLRVFAQNGTNDGVAVYVSWGQSGFFVVQSWDHVPGWLVGVTVPMMCIGPAIVVLYFLVHALRKKNE